MDLAIAGRKALLAGSSAGMGRACALALAREGADIYMSARGEERLLASAREIAAETGAKVVPIVADHGSREGREKLLATCPDPDILVITCSPPRFLKDYRDVEEDEWISSLSTTLVGPIELMRATVEGMASRGFGRVVNIGTVAAKYPIEVRLLSGPSRAALCNYTAAVAKRLAPHNVTMNNILPGMFHTPSMREVFSERAAANATTYEVETQKWVADLRIPAGRFGDVADVGAFCSILCSQYAGYITGQSIVLDGGLLDSVF